MAFPFVPVAVPVGWGGFRAPIDVESASIPQLKKKLENESTARAAAVRRADAAEARVKDLLSNLPKPKKEDSIRNRLGSMKGKVPEAETQKERDNVTKFRSELTCEFSALVTIMYGSEDVFFECVLPTFARDPERQAKLKQSVHIAHEVTLAPALSAETQLLQQGVDMYTERIAANKALPFLFGKDRVRGKKLKMVRRRLFMEFNPEKGRWFDMMLSPHVRGPKSITEKAARKECQQLVTQHDIENPTQNSEGTAIWRGVGATLDGVLTSPAKRKELGDADLEGSETWLVGLAGDASAPRGVNKTAETELGMIGPMPLDGPCGPAFERPNAMLPYSILALSETGDKWEALMAKVSHGTKH